MEYVIGGLLLLLELVFFSFCGASFLRKKANSKITIITMAVTWLIGMVYTNFGGPQIVKIAISFLMFCVVYQILFDGTWHRKCLIVCLAFGTGSIVDIIFQYGLCAILAVPLSQIYARQFYYSVTAVSSKLLAILLAWVFMKCRKKDDYQNIEKKWLMLTLAFPIISFAMLLVIYDLCWGMGDLPITAIVFSCVLAISNIAIIYLIHLMECTSRKKQDLALLKQKMTIQTDSIMALEKSYRAQRKSAHEHMHQLQTIGNLIVREEYTAVGKYISQLQDHHNIRVFPVNSRHPIIDAVLNHKYQMALEKGINIQIHVNDLSAVAIKSDYIVVLLSNLLDNAIEACCQAPSEKLIECSIECKETLFISIRNTSQPVVIDGTRIATTKSASIEHGYGLPHICQILDELNAEYAFSYEEGWFTFVSETPKY